MSTPDLLHRWMAYQQALDTRDGPPSNPSSPILQNSYPCSEGQEVETDEAPSPVSALTRSSSHSNFHSTLEVDDEPAVSTSLPGDHAGSHGLPVGHISRKPLPTHSARDLQSSKENADPPVSVGVNMWNSFWLRNEVVIAFAITFIAMIIALILLWHYSNLYNGISTQVSTNRYAWSYGPTAIFVITISLWRQVDIHVKQLVPWEEMRSGSGKPEQTVLLDYISVFLPTILWKASRKGHSAVLATSWVFILLKITTIASTALLILLSTNLSKPSSSLIAITNFNASEITTSSPGLLDGVAVNGNPADDEISGSPVYTYYGLKHQGLPYPKGTDGLAAFQVFRVSQTPLENISAVALVDAFIPNFNCEIADVHILKLPTNASQELSNGPGTQLQITVDSRYCYLGYSSNSDGGTIINPKRPQSEILIDIDSPQWTTLPSRQLKGNIFGGNCSGYFAGYNGPSWTGSDDAPLLLTMLDIRYSQKTNGTFIDTSSPAQNWSTAISSISGIICNPKYQIQKVNVTSDGSRTNGLVPATKGVMLDGFTHTNLSFAFWNLAFYASNALFKNTTGQQVEQIGGNVFDLMSSAIDKEGYSAMLNAQNFVRGAQEVFSGIMTQYAHENLISQGNTTLTGQVRYQELRLHIRNVSLWVMVSCLATALVLTIVVLFTKPQSVVPRDPNSIEAVAAIFTASQDFQDLLRGVGRSATSAIEARVHYFIFNTRITTTTFSIEPSELPKSDQDKDTDVNGTTMRKTGGDHWHRPIVTRKPMIALVLLLPLILIGSLEAIQQVSQRNDGFVSISKDHVSGFAQNAWTSYFPALTMLLLATLYNSLEFNILMFSPYNSLKLGSDPAHRSLFSNNIQAIPPISLWKSARAGHIGAFLATSAALVSSLLTIVVSGLYSIGISPTLVNADLQQIEKFNLDWVNSLSDDNGAARTLNLIEYSNLSYPGFTYDELAFPKVQLQQGHNPAENAVISTTLPALRASLDCIVLQGDQYSIATYPPYFPLTSSSAEIHATAVLPNTCQFGGPGRNSSFVNWDSYIWSLSSSENVYGGILQDLLMGQNVTGGNYDINAAYPIPDNPAGCPSLAFSFGLFRPNNTTAADVTTMICSQNIQQVKAEVHLLLPNLEFDPSQPPVVDESSVSYLTNGTAGITSFPFRPRYNLFTNLDKQVSTQSGSPANPDLSSIDPFFQTVISGKDGIPAVELSGPSNIDRLMHATNHLYRRYMAQAISANMRQPTSSTSPTFTASYTDTTHYRLKQNLIPKVILQAMLGVMFLCGAGAYWLTRMRYTLPHNPCSIAGVASLLAGSELCTRAHVPEGSEWLSGREARKRGIFEGLVFSLGWWEGGGRWGERRFGIDVGRALGGVDEEI